MNDLENMGMEVELDIYPPAGGKVELRQLALGHQPFILIEPKMDGDRVILSVTSSVLSDRAEHVVEALESFVGVLREAVERNGVEP